MPRLLKSFPVPELALKLLAFDNEAGKHVSLQFPAGIPQAPFPGAAIPFKSLRVHPRSSLAEAGGWHHGGINE